MTLYTIGYSGRSIEEIEKVIKLTSAVLVDVRLKPSSRVPEFNRGRLEKRLGSRYVHIPELGNLEYRGTGIKLANPKVGAEKVAALLGAGQDVILLCACKDVETCHRKVVAQLVSDATGCTVNHILHKIK